MIKNTVKFFLVLLFTSQLTSCITYKVDTSGQNQPSPSDRIDDVEKRNEDLFKELN